MMQQFRQTGALAVQQGEGGVVDPLFTSASADEPQLLDAIAQTWREHEYLLDPHSAVGVSVASRVAGDAAEPIVCLATAHPAKFPAAIQKATGEDIARHPAIDRLMDLPTRCETIANDPEAIRRFMVETIG